MVLSVLAEYRLCSSRWPLLSCSLFALSITGCALDLAKLPSQPFELSASTSVPTQDVETDASSITSSRHSPELHLPAISPQNLSNNERLAQPLIITGENSIESPDARPITTQDNEDLQSEAGSETRGLLDINAVNAPIDALMYSIAQQYNYQLHIVGSLSGRVTLKTMQHELSGVLHLLSEQVAFTWSIKANTLFVRAGPAYHESYTVDYLNIIRRTQSSVGLATQVGTINSSSATGEAIANSSRTLIENSSEHNFWVSLSDDLTLLLSSAESAAAQDSSPGSFSINAEAGLVSLYGTPKQQIAVRRYLDKLNARTHRQVLIEATVVEVALSESFEAGIDWQLLANSLSGVSAAQILVGAPVVNAESVQRLPSPTGLVSLVQRSGAGDLTATLSLLERFGDVKILSRPRIIALNNQPSVLKVVDNRVYFTAKVERTQTDTNSDVLTETEIHTVPVGLVMSVTPQISSSGEVMLNVRPTLSRILGFVNDPNPELAFANVRNGVPEIQVREMESMLSVQSGEVAVIGGLMQELIESDKSQLPGISRIPLIKHLFAHRVSTQRQTELLIVLRPTIVPLAGRGLP